MFLHSFFGSLNKRRQLIPQARLLSPVIYLLVKQQKAARKKYQRELRRSSVSFSFLIQFFCRQSDFSRARCKRLLLRSGTKCEDGSIKSSARMSSESSLIASSLSRLDSEREANVQLIMSEGENKKNNFLNWVGEGRDEDMQIDPLGEERKRFLKFRIMKNEGKRSDFHFLIYIFLAWDCAEVLSKFINPYDRSNLCRVKLMSVWHDNNNKR